MQSVVTVDDDGNEIEITPRNERHSSLFLSKYEVGMIVGIRAQHIASGTRGVLVSDKSPSLQPARRKTLRDDRTLLRMPPESPFSELINTTEKTQNSLSRATDPVLIAKYELLYRRERVGLLIQRRFPDGRTETIPVAELDIDASMLDLSY